MPARTSYPEHRLARASLERRMARAPLERRLARAWVRVALAFACALLTAWPAHARAGVPPIDGHLTDPGHRLRVTEKDSLEETLGKIQSDTQIDCAGWILNEQVPANELNDLGHEAYEHWHIGHDWENGVLFVFPLTGPAVLIQKGDRPALNEAEVSRVLAADAVPQPSLSKRIEHDAAEIGAILRVGSKAPKPRPPGKGDFRGGMIYLAGALAVVLLAIVMTFVRRRPQHAA